MAIEGASESKNQHAPRHCIGGIAIATMLAMIPFEVNAEPTLQQEYKIQQKEWQHKELLRLQKYAKCVAALNGDSDYLALKIRGDNQPILSGYLVNGGQTSFMKVKAHRNMCQFFGPYEFNQKKAFPYKEGLCTTTEALEKYGTHYSIVRYESCPNRAVKVSRHIAAEGLSKTNNRAYRCSSGNIIIAGDEYKCIPKGRIGKSI